MPEIVSSSSFFRSDGDGDASNPVATVDEIWKRLQRPIPSSPPSRLTTSANLQPHDSVKKREEESKKKRRLDDYLDSKLLSAISSKMKDDRWDWGAEKKQRRVAEFDWPTEELRALSEARRRDVTDGAVNEEGVGGKGSCSPFRRFEETVLTLSHRR